MEEYTMFKSGTVTIVVDDLKKAEQFYVEILGLKVQFQVEGHLVQVEAPGLTIGLVHPREGQDSHPENQETFILVWKYKNWIQQSTC